MLKMVPSRFIAFGSACPYISVTLHSPTPVPPRTDGGPEKWKLSLLPVSPARAHTRPGPQSPMKIDTSVAAGDGETLPANRLARCEHVTPAGEYVNLYNFGELLGYGGLCQGFATMKR